MLVTNMSICKDYGWWFWLKKCEWLIKSKKHGLKVNEKFNSKEVIEIAQLSF